MTWRQLSRNGAQILCRSGDARGGFHYDYRIGKNLGRVTISPVSLNSAVQRAMPLPKGTVDVATKVELAEKWYPKQQTTIEASLKDFVP